MQCKSSANLFLVQIFARFFEQSVLSLRLIVNIYSMYV